MIWVILKFHKILEIINKLDSNSISYNLNDIIYIISSTMWIKVIKWINDYKRAREAIIHYFSDIKFLKFKDIEENASEIWKCFHDEYDKFFNLKYVHVSNDLVNLKKNNKTFMKDYINHFE